MTTLRRPVLRSALCTAIFLLPIILARSAPLFSSCPDGVMVLANTERQGCCSHHGGVCGCLGDRALCCDGKPSPTCGC